MRWFLLSVVVLESACTSGEVAAATSRNQSALALSTVATGHASEHLGAAIAFCSQTDFVASAPGTHSVRFLDDAGTSSLPLDGGLNALACVDLQPTVSSDTGVWRWESPSWHLMTLDPARAVAIGPGVVFADFDGTVVRQIDTSGGASSVASIPGTLSIETLLFREGSVYVGAPGYSGVWAFDYDGGNQSERFAIYEGPLFGQALAVGDVLLGNPGAELVVGAQGAVHIFALDGGALLTLQLSTDGRHPSFGRALAIQAPTVLNTQGTLWVGEPEANAVHAFSGDAGTRVDAPPDGGGLFGTALATNGKTLMIGAPNAFGGSGAVYSVTLNDCGLSCVSRGCTDSVCLNGICRLSPRVCPAGLVCDPGTTTCVPSTRPDSGGIDAGGIDAGDIDAGDIDAGDIDAGDIDAGDIDAGDIDAGDIDAGDIDAGNIDAGDIDAGSYPDDEVNFVACGCSSTSPAALMFLGIALFFTRARSHKTASRP